jgi:hypothetical protein
VENGNHGCGKTALEEEHERRRCIQARAAHIGKGMIDVHGRESINVYENQQERERHVAERCGRKMVRKNACASAQSSRRGEPMDERSRHRKRRCVVSCMRHATRKEAGSRQGTGGARPG